MNIDEEIQNSEQQALKMNIREMLVYNEQEALYAEKALQNV